MTVAIGRTLKLLSYLMSGHFNVPVKHRNPEQKRTIDDFWGLKKKKNQYLLYYKEKRILTKADSESRVERSITTSKMRSGTRGGQKNK